MGLENVRRHPFYLFYLCVLSGLLLLGWSYSFVFFQGLQLRRPGVLGIGKTAPESAHRGCDTSILD